jgi:prevent-host-death family protein
MAESDPKLVKTVNVHEAKTHFSKLLERAHAGEEIVLAKAGKPYAKLVPFDPPPPKEPRRPGQFKDVVPELPDSFFFDPLPEDELRMWEGR